MSDVQSREHGLLKSIAVKPMMKGVAPGYSVEPVRTQAQVTFPDGNSVSRTRVFQMAVPIEADQSESESLTPLRYALGGSLFLNTERFRYSQWPVLVTVDDSTYLRSRNEPATGTANVEFRATRPEVVAEMALEKGARYEKGSHRVVIEDVLRHSEGCTVILRESFVNLLFGEKARESTQYVLRNHNRKEAFVGWASPMFYGVGLFGVTYPSDGLGRLTVRYLEFRFPQEGRTWKESPAIDENWLKDARLLRIETVYVGRFWKSLRIADFRMGAK